MPQGEVVDERDQRDVRSRPVNRSALRHVVGDDRDRRLQVQAEVGLGQWCPPDRREVSRRAALVEHVARRVRGHGDAPRRPDAAHVAEVGARLRPVVRAGQRSGQRRHVQRNPCGRVLGQLRVQLGEHGRGGLPVIQRVLQGRERFGRGKVPVDRRRDDHQATVPTLCERRHLQWRGHGAATAVVSYSAGTHISSTV